MKKLLFTLCMLAGLYACSTMDAPEPAATAPADSAPITSIVRTPEEARTLAAEAFTNFYGTSRSLAHIKNVRTFTAASPSRSGAATDTTFYVVNLDDNQGYAVIAARRDIEPVLAVTESGNIESIDSIENPGAKMFFEELNYAHNIELDRDKIDSTTILQWNYDIGYGPINNTGQTEYREVRTLRANHKIDNRAPFEWGQIYPEGISCPNGVAGCTNVATALAFSYFNYPKSFDDSHGNIITLDWTGIKQHKKSFNSYNYIDNCFNAHQQLSQLCAALGRRNGSEYISYSYSNPLYNATGTALSPAYETIKSYFPNSSEIKNGIPDAYQSLGIGIIFVSGRPNIDISGHDFIIDGYNHQEYKVEYYKREPLQKEWTFIRSSTCYINYNHVNWGWNGADNGYFSLSCLKNSEGYEYDGDRTSTKYDFGGYVRYFIVNPTLEINETIDK